MGLFLRKSYLLRCWDWLHLLNWIWALTLSPLLKLPPRKLEPWFVLWCFFLLKLLCISRSLPYSQTWNTVVMVWAGAPSCYLKLLDQLQKWIWKTVVPSLAASLEPLNHCQNIASLSLFYRHYFGRCSSELAQLVPLPYFGGRFICYSDRLLDYFFYHS